MLKVGVERLPHRPAQWEVHVECARRTHFLHDKAHGCQYDSGQSCGFENMGKRTHGTRAEGSDRCQENDVDTIFEHLLCAGWAGVQP